MSSEAENSAEQPGKRVIGRPFQPGVSGNPGGRPSLAKKLREMAQDEAEGSLRALVSIRDNLTAKPAERIAASNAILDRAVGKPTQPLSGSDDPEKPALRIERVIIDPAAE